MRNVRPPAVAGMFYPAQAAVLRQTLDACFAQAQAGETALRPKALVAPHAGYIYSGPVAASAYRLLEPWADNIRRVVLLGPVHRVWVPGLALPGADAFETPLGQVPVDHEAIRAIADLPQVTLSPAAHDQEHSLEVHLPFLQRVLGDFSLVPLAVGGAAASAVAQVLDRLWGGAETLIVVSSDLSHYLPYHTAADQDRQTARAILRLDDHLQGEQACGAAPLNGLLLAARQRGLGAHLLDLRNSGDTAGDRQRVVGYGAFAFTEVGHA
ncbi:MAG: AmmeMemoRadiSam system protein B [Pseudomonadota bacterium]